MSARAPTASSPAVSVRVQSVGLDERLTLPLDRAVSFGRDAECEVPLCSGTVSRKHASLFLRNGGLVVRDHSSNGTRVNGERIQAALREVGSRAALEIGPFTISVALAGPSLEAVVGHEDANAGPDLDAGAPAQAHGDARAGSNAELASERGRDAALRKRLRAQLLDSLDLVALDREQMSEAAMRPRVVDALDRIFDEGDLACFGAPARELLRDALCDEVLGLGPLEPLLRDPEVSEIMLVDAQTIYVERRGQLERSLSYFTDDTAVRAALERIVTPLGRRIDESSPIVDARLKDGSRVNAVIPPLAIKGPCITIRKFPSKRLTLERLVELGTLSRAMARFLDRAVQVRVNLVIAGGTGSGKTTLLNVLSAAIPQHERVVTIEDAAELSLAQPHVVALETRPPNMEGAGAVTIRDLVKNALRMRPDRIVVGECRGGEALDMLQAMNTGHDGSMTTTHANSPREALQRLETLCLMAGLDLPLTAIRRQIATSVELLVQQARFADGARRITRISELVGLDPHGELELRDLFRFDVSARSQSASEGEFAATGSIPRCVERFLTAGLLDEEGACF
jgi:pilus assembly protein CpaF